jgi:hypothetical protein
MPWNFNCCICCSVSFVFMLLIYWFKYLFVLFFHRANIKAHFEEMILPDNLST